MLLRITKTKKDENQSAKFILDDIIEETESEDWNKPGSEKSQKGGKVRSAKLTPTEELAFYRFNLYFFFSLSFC